MKAIKRQRITLRTDSNHPLSTFLHYTATEQQGSSCKDSFTTLKQRYVSERCPYPMQAIATFQVAAKITKSNIKKKQVTAKIARFRPVPAFY